MESDDEALEGILGATDRADRLPEVIALVRAEMVGDKETLQAIILHTDNLTGLAFSLTSTLATLLLQWENESEEVVRLGAEGYLDHLAALIEKRRPNT